MRGSVVVVGAGVSGLTSAYMLASQDWDVTVVEKERRVGGLARSFYYNGFTFDCGPHILHTVDKPVEEFMLHVLGENRLDINRSSTVYFFNRYHDWPLKRNTVFKLPFKIMIGSLVDLFRKKTPRDDSFQEYILSIYGKTLFKHFFKDYTEKFVKYTCDKLHADWASTGISRAIVVEKAKTITLRQILASLLFPKPVGARFYYPSRGGIGEMYRGLSEMVTKKGGRVLLDSKVTDACASAGRITELIVTNGKTGEQITLRPDIVVWTAQPRLLGEMLGIRAWSLKYLDGVFYHIEADGKAAMDTQWIYYGSKDFLINRVTYPCAFSALNCPEGKHGLSCELCSLDDDSTWKEPELLIGQVIDDVTKAGLVKSRDRINDVHIVKMRNTYPVYTIDYREKLSGALKNFHRYKNLMFTGRTGSFCYINMHHCMRMAFDMIEALTKNDDPVDWHKKMMETRGL